jgi:hypothetical protein
MTIWSILRQLEKFYGPLVYFVVIRYIYPRFGILYQEKSGNPGLREAQELISSEPAFVRKIAQPTRYHIYWMNIFQLVN